MNFTLFPFLNIFEQINITRIVRGINVNAHILYRSQVNGEVFMKIGQMRYGMKIKYDLRRDTMKMPCQKTYVHIPLQTN